MNPHVAFLLSTLPAPWFQADPDPSRSDVARAVVWGDYDGDGMQDVATVSSVGRLQLLHNSGEGRFEDTTVLAGLGDVRSAGLTQWVDYDQDGKLDLFVGARAGESRLFQNQGGGAFVDLSGGSGLATSGEVLAAAWFDLDGDARLDLHILTAESSLVFRGIEGGFFERVELPPAGIVGAGSSRGTTIVLSAPEESGEATRDSEAKDRRVEAARPAATNSGPTPAPTVNPAATTPVVVATGCAISIRDQAAPSTCIQASTDPVLGKLYPLSSNLFVSSSGNVGVGTTSPAKQLDVAGEARVTGTLTLAPGGDQALDVSAGSIYKSGALFIHTKGGSRNTALGREALSSVIPGASNNTAIGAYALSNNTYVSDNTASGAWALYSDTTGYFNTADGAFALMYNTTGSYNTASGLGSLGRNTTGCCNTSSGAGSSQNTTGTLNTASGFYALYQNTTGARNIALGHRAGYDLTTGSDNIAVGNLGVAAESATIRIGTSGTHTRAFLAGIRGVTTGVGDAIPVLVDSAGQLGTVSSSRRFKDEIRDMGDASERLLALRPVVFRYRPEVQAGERPLEYGLIAEEVAEVFPELVVRDEDGRPFTVKYHLLSSMLLNELKKLRSEVTRLRGLETRLAALESRTSGDRPAVTR